MGQITRYGIIGCGMMGHEHIRNIALLDDTEIIGIVEPDAGMADEAARLAPTARFFADIPALLAVDALDCLVIASPNHMHMAQLQEIAAHRPLPVLVEKPLFTATEDHDAILALQQTAAAPHWVAMEYRYMPPIAAFLDEVEAATGGIRMLTIREHRFPFLEKIGDWNRFNANTGGTFVEKCCHFFDLMRLALGSEPVRVSASIGMDINHLDERYDGQTPDIDDNGYVIVEFASGARAMLELCMFAEGALYQEEISAVGAKGKIAAFVPGPGRFWPASRGPAPMPKLVLSPRAHELPVTEREIPVDPALLKAGDHNGATFYQHAKFLDVVRGKGTPEVSLDDGRMAVLMGMAAHRASKEARVVRLDEFAS